MLINKTRGFSLLELLLAMSIGLIIITIIGKTFINCNRTYKIETSLSIMQENAGFAARMMREAVQTAGMVGAAKMAFYLPLQNQGTSLYNQIDFNNYFTVYHGNNNIWQPSLPDFLEIQPKLNTDVIMIKSMSAITANLKKDLNESNKIYVSFMPEFNQDDDIIIADCLHVVTARIKSVYRSPENQQQILTTTQIIHGKFNSGTEVGKIQSNVFYIHDTGRKNIRGKKIYSLYHVSATDRKEELLSNIVNMKISALIKNKLLKVALTLFAEDRTLLPAKTFQFTIRLFNHA